MILGNGRGQIFVGLFSFPKGIVVRKTGLLTFSGVTGLMGRTVRLIGFPS